MDEYIKRDDAIKHLRGACIAKYPLSFSCGIFASADEISKLPTADVVPKSEVERLEAELEKQNMWERLLKAESHALIIQEAKSKIVDEYRKRVNRKMEKYTVFGREYIQRIMREVEKELVGEKDV